MVKIFIIFLVIIFLLAVMLTVAVMLRSKKNQDDVEETYLDENGNHIYYNRSIIAKEKFRRDNPDQHPRTLRRLFSRK